MASISTVASEHGALPLQPIERAPSLFLRLVYWATRKRYGKTPTAFRVVYARLPATAFVSFLIYAVLDLALRIPKELRYLLQIAIASGNDCTFCRDIMLAEAIRARIGTKRFAALADFETTDAFDARERAALAYAKSLGESLRVPDAIFDELKRHFDERQITEIVWVCAVERYFNSLALPLRIGSDRLAEER